MKNELYKAQIRTNTAIYEIARVIYESATMLQVAFVDRTGKMKLNDISMDHVKSMRKYVD